MAKAKDNNEVLYQFLTDTDKETKEEEKRAKKKELNQKRKLAFENSVKRLSRPIKKEFVLKTLSVDLLRPLVDLAYWTNFVEVRRDTAAAFATLAMNEINLPILCEAGTLGAILALIKGCTEDHDPQVLRDSALALSFLVNEDSIRVKLLKTHDSMVVIFQLTKSTNVDVKRASITILLNLCSSMEARREIVKQGGVPYILALALGKDLKECKHAVRVLKLCSEIEENKLSLCHPVNLQKSMISFMESSDITIKNDYLDYFLNLSQIPTNQTLMINNGILVPLIFHTMDSITTVDLCFHSLQCLNILATQDNNKETMVNEGVAPYILKIIQRLSHKTISLNPVTPSPPPTLSPTRPATRDKSTHSLQQPARKIHLHTTIERHNVSVNEKSYLCCFSILHHLSKSPQKSSRHTLTEQGVFEVLLHDNVIYHEEKKISRYAMKAVAHLCASNDEALHEIIMQYDLLNAILKYLNSQDYEIKFAAVMAISSLSSTSIARKEIIGYLVLPKVFELVTLPDPNLRSILTLIMFEFTKDNLYINDLLKLGILNKVLKYCSLAPKNDGCRLNALKCLNALCASKEVQESIKGMGFVGTIISVSKTAPAEQKFYANLILKSFQNETAATKLQALYRGHHDRREKNKK